MDTTGDSTLPVPGRAAGGRRGGRVADQRDIVVRATADTVTKTRLVSRGMKIRSG
jgi:hypothetical protein